MWDHRHGSSGASVVIMVHLEAVCVAVSNTDDVKCTHPTIYSV